MISEEIRKLIKEERLRQGLSKDDLAERAGLSSRLIEYWEQDKRKATNIESIDKALKALGIKYTIGQTDSSPNEESNEQSNKPNEPNNESSDEQSNEDEQSNDLDDKKVLPTFSATAHQKDDEE